MLETPHAILGAAIATKIPNPFIAIPLAFLSHFALEKVPHWNPHINTETKKFGKPTKQSTLIIAVDVAVALVSGFAIAWQYLPNYYLFATIIACCFASVLPDLIEAPYFFFKMRNKFLEKWLAFQKSIQADTTPLWGLTTQLITVIATLFWIYKK